MTIKKKKSGKEKIRVSYPDEPKVTRADIRLTQIASDWVEEHAYELSSILEKIAHGDWKIVDVPDEDDEES